MIHITDHIGKYLNEFINDDDSFLDIYNRINAEDKKESKNALIYVNRLLDECAVFSRS
jgi:hypothetical protein